MSEEISPGPSGRPSRGVRASDEDREQLIDELREHSVAGRLDTEELERRVSAAYEAGTTGELDALRSDLPVPSRQVALQHAVGADCGAFHRLRGQHRALQLVIHIDHLLQAWCRRIDHIIRQDDGKRLIAH